MKNNMVKKTLDVSIGANILGAGMNAIKEHDVNGIVKTTMAGGFSKKVGDIFGVK